MADDDRSLHSDELDIAIVDALSVNPRAAWAQIAATVGADAATVSRRWRRLEEAGLAWAICVRGTRTLDNVHDHIDVRCQPGHAARIAGNLSRDPRCVSVSTVTGGADVRVLVDVPDLTALDAFMTLPLWRDRDIHSVEHNVALAVYHHAQGWTSGGISATQRESLQPSLAELRRAAPLLDERDRALARLLQEDVRMPVATLARRLGTSEATASRHVRRLVTTRAVQLRVEAAHRVVGWPWSVGLYAAVPAGRVREAGRFAAGLPGVRGSYAVTNPRWNLMTIFWMREAADIFRIQAALEGGVDDLRVVSRQLTLRHHKRMGMLFDHTGRATRWVPTPL